MSLDSLQTLFLEELRDIYHAEKQLVRALPRLAKAASAPELQEAIVRQRPANELKDIAVKAGMRTLRQTGLRKVANGLTTIDEVLRVTFAD